MEKCILYKFNHKTLQTEPVNLKILWLIPLIIIFSLAFKLIYFNAAFIEVTNWRGQKEKATIHEYFKEQQRINSYDKLDKKDN